MADVSNEVLFPLINKIVAQTIREILSDNQGKSTRQVTLITMYACMLVVLTN